MKEGRDEERKEGRKREGKKERKKVKKNPRNQITKTNWVWATHRQKTRLFFFRMCILVIRHWTEKHLV